MERVKRTTLFRKNHIEITKEDYPIKNLVPGVIRTFSGASDHTSYFSSNFRYYKKKKVILKSPLGFYYEKTITVGSDKNKGKFSSTKSGTVYRISLPSTRYTITYLTSYGESRIQRGFDGVRPWGVDPSDKAMPDHFIDDLKKEIDKILDIVSQYKLSEKPEELRKDIYLDLFGFPDGPKYQTDLEKIESHGFDTKVSFRKRKQ